MWKYILFWIAIRTIGRLPVRAGYALAEVGGRLAYWLPPHLPRHRNHKHRHVEGKGVIVRTAHLATPELAVQGMLPRGVKVLALTEPVQPHRVARLVDNLRASKGHSFAPGGFAG